MSRPGPSAEPVPIGEVPIGRVRGTRDWLPGEYARMADLERLLLDRFARAGYEPLRTPILEFTELHERKSGAAIVSKLFELAQGRAGPLCLRPELTASIVRAYTAAESSPVLPWRVSMAGPVFRFEPDPQVRGGRYREFQQVGVELLGAAGPVADAEVIALADWSLREAGIPDATVRVGHVGLILEMLDRSGLPPSARSALIEVLGEAAAEGGTVRDLDAALDRLTGWLRSAPNEADSLLPAVDRADDGGVDRLFRTVMPDVTGRRSGREILHRLRRKWDLGHSLPSVLDRVRQRAHELADLRGPAAEVLDRLTRDFEGLAPGSVAELRDLVALLGHHGIDAGRVELDLGFGRGIGFYSQMIFELVVPSPDGSAVEVCGGGRYDGLARVLGSDRDDRGVGFAFGLERLRQVLDARGLEPGPRPAEGVLVLPLTPDRIGEAVRLAQSVRAGQQTRAVVLETWSPASVLAYAERKRPKSILLVADDLDREGAIQTLEWNVSQNLDECLPRWLEEARGRAEGRRR